MSRTPAPGDASPQMVEALDRWDDEGGAATSVRFDAVLAYGSGATGSGLPGRSGGDPMERSADGRAADTLLRGIG